MSYSVTPLNGYLAITPHKEEEVILPSGLILGGEARTSAETVTSTAKLEGPQRGVVRAVGAGRVDEGIRCAMDVEVGDEVFYMQGSEVPIDKSDDLLIPEGQIVAKMVDGEVSPYWDKALVRWDKNDAPLASGVILANHLEVGYEEGEVLSVGPGYVKKGVRVPMDLAVGDRVLFNQFMGVEIETDIDDMRRLFLIREFDVYGVLPPSSV